MLTAEGCRQRRLRFWERLDPKPDTGYLLLADPIHLAYLADCWVDPFSLGAGFKGYLLVRDPHAVIFFDGRIFSRRYQIDAVIQSAQKFGTPFRTIECTCSEETARQRLERDQAAGHHPAANRSFDLYQRLKVTFEPIPEPKLVVDTDQPLDGCVGRSRAFISGEAGHKGRRPSMPH